MARLSVSVSEAADLIGVSPWMVRQLVHAGHLAKIPHLGSRVRIARTECDRFVSEGVKHDPQADVEGRAS